MPLNALHRGFARLGAVFALAVTLAAASLQDVQAAAGPWAENDQAAVRLIASGAATGESGEVQLGLHFKLSDGWKIYWRSPGDAGFPPTTDWAASSNLAEAMQSWPVPHRFSLFGLETFGYGDEVVFPINARLERIGERLSLRGQVNYLVCDEICIPHNQEVSLDLAAGPDSRSPEGFLIDSYSALVPDDGTRAGWTLVSTSLVGDMESPSIEVVAKAKSSFTEPDLLLEGPPGFTFGKPEVELSNGGQTVLLRAAVGKTSVAKGVIEGKQLTVTVTDGNQGMEQAAVARFDSMAAGSTSSFDPITLLPILGLALLGGLILNLMPCVLPVLSIKLLSVVEQGGRSRSDVRAGFLASAAGIITSFLALAAVAVALKSGGAAVGWGIQFQQPLFLTAITLLVALFAFNLLGFFEIGLPSGLANALGRPTPQGEMPKSKGRELAGHFGSGAFATLLATPCSAPFLGTAVGFALARGASEIFLIFTMLGIGLAAPFLLVAAFPGLASRLPKPGGWMVTLRYILGLALIATAIWLLTVLASQIGTLATAVAAALLIGLGIVLWLGRNPAKARGALATGIALLLALGAFALPSSFAEAPKVQVTEDNWTPLDESEIAALVDGGNLVFVDVTADWCITCQVNKKLVLDSEEVQEILNLETTVAMRGDWTSPDETITAYLASFGRYGIPFNAVYGPGAPEGVALPELLTLDAVREAVAQASGDTAAKLAAGETAQ